MNRSAYSERALGARLVISLFAFAVTLLAVAATASATPVVSGEYTYYSTADLCKLDLSPKTATHQTGTVHTAVATVTSPGLPSGATASVSPSDTWAACFQGDISKLMDATVNFKVTSGPHAGFTGNRPLNASGQATFSYIGSLAGTDTIEADLELPDLCGQVWNGPLDDSVAPRAALPSACLPSVEFTGPQTCFRPTIVGPTEGCQTVTLTDTANVTWTTPPPTVVAQADPSVTIAQQQRCVSHQFRVRPSYANGTVKTSTLFIDGKKVATLTGPGSFLVDGPTYGAGKHNIEVVTSFTNGKSASQFSSFTRCKIRTAARKVSPKFTG